MKHHHQALMSILAKLCFFGIVAAVIWHMPPAAAAENQRLDAALQMAAAAAARLEEVEDYTATLVKRERIKGKLGDYEVCRLKVRHEPFSVYMKFLKPETLAGREAIYVAGQNDGELLAHDPNYKAMGLMSLQPDGAVAMLGQRYPITRVGLKNLLRLLIERGQQEQSSASDVKVTFRKGAKVGGREAAVIELKRKNQGDDPDSYRARIYIDRESRLPIRYEAHGWPATPGDEPPLIEEYTYLNLKLNVGLADRHFDTRNPDYMFPEKRLLGSMFLQKGNRP